ncbi:MAG: MFS transporter, partial [Frankiaceae bacterium]|nr:MFS transporter [Frankiaceae bacterium]
MDADAIHRRRWAILATLMICLLVVVLDNTILNVALRTMQDDLGASQSQMQWAIDSYALVFAGLLIPWGVAGDRFGRRRVLLGGMLVFGATSALSSFADTPAHLIAARALMGVGAAAVQPQTLSIIQNVFDPSERGKAIGIWAGAAGSAVAIGPLTGGLLLKYFWWGSIFLVNVPIVIVGAVLIVLLVPDSRDPRPGKPDPVGVATSMAGLVLLVYGIIEGGNSNRWLTLPALGSILLGCALLAVFVRQQLRSTHPTIDMSLFTHRGFSAGTGAIGLSFFALMGGTFFLSYFMQAVRGYTALATGVALIAVAAAQLIAAPSSARLAARFGTAPVAGVGLTLAAIGFGTYVFYDQSTPQWLLELSMVAQGAGMGLTMAPSTAAVMAAVPRAKSGAGSAVNNTVRQVGGALGVAVLGSLLAVSFRGHLGADAPARLAAQLDQPPPAIVSPAPPLDHQVAPLVRSDTSESIVNALQFARDAGGAMAARASALPPGSVSDTQ